MVPHSPARVSRALFETQAARAGRITMATTLVFGKLFKVIIHTDKLANPDVDHVCDDGEVITEAGVAYGYGSESDQPTEGEPQILADGYTIVLASESNCDDSGNLILVEGITTDDVTVGEVIPEMGYWDSDGTATIVLVDGQSDRFSNCFAVTC